MSKNDVVIEGKGQFKSICEQALPHLNAIEKILKENGAKESASITIGTDGYMSLRIYGSGWEMARYSHDTNAVIRNEYREEIAIPDAEKKE